MKVKTIPNVLLSRDGRRMDGAPYMSGSQETKLLIERLDAPKARLHTLTHGYDGGIYNGPKFARNWVQAPEHGVPFLNSSDMLQADLTNLPYLRKSDAHSPRLSYLRLAPGMILISCTGTIGRMAYARPDMDGIWSSQHIMKVVPDSARIPPGYLYAFLSSKYGVPMIVGGTYGSIIQSIEPHHIADLPVPRLGEAVEQRAHALVEEAAQLRSRAARKLQAANRQVELVLNVADLTSTPIDESAWRGNIISSSMIRSTSRLEGYYYNPVATRAEIWAKQHKAGYWLLKDVASVFDVPPFKHIYVEPGYGLPFYTSGDLFNVERIPEKYLSKTRTRSLKSYVIKQGWVLLARSGQLGGIIGRPQFADSSLDAATTSDHVIRIVPNTEIISPGYLYAYLATSQIGYPLLTRTMTGASVPALWPTYLQQIPIVQAASEFMKDIDALVQDAFEHRVSATSLEFEARSLVERTIEGAA